MLNREDGWIKWRGGECPVPKGTLVDVKYRDGGEASCVPAMEFVSGGRFAVEWDHSGTNGDIIGYRLSVVAGTTKGSAASPLEVQVAGNHYKKLKIQPIEYIHANGIPFAEGSAIKYLTRWRDKGGIKDLEKARHFIDLLIELETRSGGQQ